MPALHWNNLIGGALIERHPAPPLAFAAASAAPVLEGPEEIFATLSRAQYQRTAGSCLSQTNASVLESDVLARVGALVQVSRMDLYWGGRALNGDERKDAGMFPSMAAMWLRDYGALPEDITGKYDATKVTTWAPKGEWNAERRLWTADLQPIPPTFEAIWAELLAGRVVPVCHLVYGQMASNPRNGLEDGAEDGYLGGHGRVICSANRKTMRFGLMNWWEGWGIPHPLHGVDSRFASHKDSYSMIPVAKALDPNWGYDWRRLARGLDVRI